MRFRSTALLAVTAGALLAIYLARDDGPAPGPPRDAPLLPGLRADDVLRLDLERPAEPGAAAEGAPPARIAVARESAEGPWRLVEPVDDAADRLVVERALAALVEAVRFDARAGIDAAEAGLAPPRLVLTLSGADDEPSHRLEVGALDAAGRRAFARAGGAAAPIALIDAAVADAIDLGAGTLREKRLFTADPPFVERVRLAGPRLELRFRRDGPFWRVESPFEGWADDAAVEALLAALAGLRALRFVADRPSDLAPFGLERPLATVTLEQAGRDETVLLGGRADRPEEIYAKRGDGPAVVATSEVVTRLISWDAERWRSRRLLHLRPAVVGSLEVRRPAGASGEAPPPPIRLERDRERWRFTAPVEAAADGEAVAALLDQLIEARYDAALPAAADPRNFALDRPLVVVLGTRQREVALEIGGRSPSERGRYVRLVETGEVCDCALGGIDALAAAWPLLRDRRLMRFPAAEIARLTVRGERRAERTFARLPDGSGYSTPDAVVDPASLARFLDAIADWTALALRPPPADPAHAGLTAPWLEVEVVRDLGEDGRTERYRLAIGRRLDDGIGYGAWLHEPGGGAPLHVVLAEAQVAALEGELVRAAPAAGTDGPEAPAGAPPAGSARESE